MDNLSDAEKLPGLSSRAGIDWIFRQLIDDAGDFIAVDPELKIVRDEDEYTFSLSNPLANEPKYRQCMEQSRMAVFLKRIIKDKPSQFIDAQIDKSMEAARVGQCAAAKRIIGELLHVQG